MPMLERYVEFVLIMSGFLLQWPTLVTLAMFPILVTMYVLLARREEREATPSSATNTGITQCGRRHSCRRSRSRTAPPDRGQRFALSIPFH